MDAMHDCFFYFRKGGVVFYCAAYIIYYCITHIFFFSSTFVLYTLEELRGDCRMRSSASSSFFLFFVQWKMVRSDGQGEMKYYSLRVPQYKSAMEKKKRKEQIAIKVIARYTIYTTVSSSRGRYCWVSSAGLWLCVLHPGTIYI